MKIAYVYDAVYPWEKGGAQKRIWELAKRLADSHDIHLYGMHYWDGPPVIEREGVTFHGVCEPYELYTDGRRSIRQALLFAGRLAEPLIQESFDVIDCQQFPYFPVVTTKLHEVARQSELVVTWYELWDDYWYDYLGYKGIFGRLTEKLALELPKTIVPISPAIKRDLIGAGCSATLQTVPNGVDFGRIQAIDPADEHWDVVYAGRLSEHKNIGLLLEAIQHLATSGIDLNVAIIGDGPERDRLQGYATDLDVTDHVEFLGFLESADDVLSHLAASDVFVLPSEREGFPNTILEANASGTPCIVCDFEDNGGTAVVEDGETGFVAPPTAEGIAERIATVHSDPGLRRHLGDRAQEFGRQHDWERISDQMASVYQQTVGETARRTQTVEVKP